MAYSDEPGGSSPASIQVITRAARILGALEGRSDGLSLTQLATATGLPRSTVHRLLAALEVEGFVAAASPGGGMRLGPMLLRLADGAHPDLQQVLGPEMRRLFGDLNETIDLAILDGDHLRFVDQIAAPHRLRAVSAVGATFPLHCTANGKAVLALMHDSEIRSVLPARMPRHTPNTVTSRRALLEEIATIRQDGVAIDREEHAIGISAVGFAFREQTGRLGAITVPMPTQRFEGREEAIRAALVLARRRVQMAVTG